MTEVISQLVPPHELLRPERTITSIIAEQKPLSTVMEKLQLGELKPFAILETFHSLRQVVDLRVNIQEDDGYKLKHDVLGNLQDLLVAALDTKKGNFTKSAVVQGSAEYSKVTGLLEKLPGLSDVVQAGLLGLCNQMIEEGVLKPEEPLPEEITQFALMDEIVHDARSIMAEISRAYDEPEGDTTDEPFSAESVMQKVSEQLNTGKLRVYLTHNESSSNFNAHNTYDADERSINLRAKEGEVFGKAIKGYLEGAYLDVKKVEAQTGMSVEEIGLRFVAMHELGHALQMSPMQPDSAIRGFLVEHPEDAVSNNFDDAVYAEQERFAEGLAIYYLTNLLVRAGVDDQQKIDSIVQAVQTEHLVSRQEWYAKSAQSNKSLGIRINDTKRKANGAFLGYGLHLDAAELLERFKYVDKTLRHGGNPANDKTRELMDGSDKGWWPKYLKEKGIDLKPVHAAVAEAVTWNKVRLERGKRLDKQVKGASTFIKVAAGLAVGALTTMGIDYVQGLYEPQQATHQSITTKAGHILEVEEVMTNGDVVFDVPGAATADLIVSRLFELDSNSYVVGKDASGEHLYIGQHIDVKSLSGTTQSQSVSTLDEVFQRLSADLQKKTGKPGKEQERLLELIDKNSEISLVGDKDLVLIETINLRNLIDQLSSEIG